MGPCHFLIAYSLIKVERLSTCLAQLVERSKFKNAGHLRRRGVQSSSPSGDSLLHCIKVLSCQKKKVERFNLLRIVMLTIH